MFNHFGACVLARWGALVCVVTMCLVDGGCSSSNLPPIQIPANAKVFRENYYVGTAGPSVPPDSSGKYYVYDEDDGEVTNVFFIAQDTPVNLDCLPRGHRYRVYYVPREGGPVAASTKPVREAHGVGTEAVLRRAREVAEKLTWLDPSWVLYGREYLRFGPTDAAENLALLSELLSMAYTMEDALPLLRDGAPKVRTLGIVMVFQKGGAPAVNAVAQLADDEAGTFSMPIPYAAVRQPGGPSHAIVEQKVKDLAAAIVKAHLSATGQYHLGWARYWAMRKGRPYGAADFVVALNRAGGSRSPIDAKQLPEIRRVGEEVRKLPMPDRFLILHRLWWHMGGRFPETQETAIVTRDELVALARELPVETRWAIVHNKAATDDPDQPQYMHEYVQKDARKIVRSIE